VTSDAINSTTPLQFSSTDDATGLILDQVTVNPLTGPPSETANGSISFSDVDAGDTHTASFQPQGNNYVGTFSLDPVTESGGSGSVAWHFAVNNSDIEFLAQGQSLTQVYSVFVADTQGLLAEQDVFVTINGVNDPPTATGQTIVTDVGPNGTVNIPDWALLNSASDPDTTDTLSVVNVSGGTGGTAVQQSGVVSFTDDATLGGSFGYSVSDGKVATSPVTATINNNASNATSLTAASGDSILIASNGTETLTGGSGNDVLIGGAGAHTLTGGGGSDIFGFLSPTDGTDTITDFNNTSAHDLIGVSASGFGGGLVAGMDVTGVFETSGDNAFQSTASLFHFDTANATLYYSASGTTGSEVALAQLPQGTTLHPNDLRIVS
jgi:VCBS repeat-containing protein